MLYEFYQMYAYKAQYFELENFVEWSVYIAGIFALSLKVRFYWHLNIVMFIKYQSLSYKAACPINEDNNTQNTTFTIFRCLVALGKYFL